MWYLLCAKHFILHVQSRCYYYQAHFAGEGTEAQSLDHTAYKWQNHFALHGLIQLATFLTASVTTPIPAYYGLVKVTGPMEYLEGRTKVASHFG